MATPEHRLISRIVQHGELKEVLAYGIVDVDFLNLQCRAIWSTLVAYYKAYQTHGSVIPEGTFRQMFSHFEFVESPHTATSALCYELRTQRLILQLKEASQAAVEQSEADPIAAATLLRTVADSIISYGATHSNDLHLSTHIDQLLQNYEMRESGAIQPALWWPWAPLNEEVGGIADEDYVLFWGRPKSKKTFVLDYVMADAYYVQDKRILCYTKEMTPDNMLLRTAAFIAQLPYGETRKGTLAPGDRATLMDLKRVVAERSRASNGRNDLIILDGKSADGHDGVSWLRAKIEQHKPDAVFIDGLYLLADERSTGKTADWQRVMHISRDVRQLILDTRVPVIATMQANRAAAKNAAAELDEIAFADSLGQDITQGFRVINEKTSPTIALVAGGSREYQLHGLRINGVPCQDFSFHSIMSEKEIERAKGGDIIHEEPENAVAHKSAAKRSPRAKSEMQKKIAQQLAHL